MAATIEGAFVLIDRATGTMEKMERQAVKTMAAIEGVGAAQDAQTRRGQTAARAMHSTSQGMKDTETRARGARRAVDDMGRSHEQSAGRVRVLENALRSLRAEFGRMRGGPGDQQMSGLQAMERDLRRAKGAMGDFLGAFGALGSAMMIFKFPALIGGFAMLAQGLVALAGGALGALPALAALASGLNLIPGAIGAALQGVLSLRAAFSGVMAAAKLGMQSQQQWTTNQRQWSQQVSSAQNAVQDALHGVSDAIYAQQEATHSLSDAYYSHQQALQGLTNAIYDQQQAQLDLTQARRDAIRTLQDMEFAASTAVLREARAGLNVRQAQQELTQAMMTPGTSQLSLESDRLAVMEAQASAAQTHTEAVRNRVDYQRARAGDPTAGPVRQVAQAQHGLAQSHQGVAAAQHQVAESSYGIERAQHGVAEAAYNVARAERGVQMAQQQLNNLMIQGNAGVSAYRKALQGLSPMQQRFVRFLVGPIGPGSRTSLIGQLQRLQESTARGLFPPLMRGIQSLSGAWPVLNRNMGRSGAIIGNLGARLLDTFFGPRSISQTNSIMRSNNVVMEHGANAVGYLADRFRRVMVVAEPLMEWLSRQVEDWARMRDETMKTAAGQDALRTRFEHLRLVLIELHTIFHNIWTIFHNVNRAAWDFNQVLMQGAANATGHWAAITGSPQGQRRLHDWFMGLLPLLRSMARLAEAVGRGLAQMTGPQANRGTARLVDGLTTLVPTLARILLNVERIFGPPIISALNALGSSLSALTGDGGPFALWLKMLTAIIKAFLWLFKVPLIGQGLVVFLASVFAVNTIAKFTLGMTGAILKVRQLAGAWRGVERARRGGMGPGAASPGTTTAARGGLLGGLGGGMQQSHTWGLRSMDGPGSEANPLVVMVLGGGFGRGGGGGFPGGGSRTGSLGTVGKDAAKVEQDLSRAESIGSKLAGLPLIGGLARFLPGGLGRGAGIARAGAEAAGVAGEVGMLGRLGGALGKFAGPLGAVLTALPAITSFVGTKGNFGERLSAAGASLINNLTFGLAHIHGSPTMAQQRAQGTRRADVSFSHFAADPTTGLLTTRGIQQYQNRLGSLQRQIYTIQHPGRIRDPFGVDTYADVDRKKLADRLAQLKRLETTFNAEQRQAGAAAFGNWTNAFAAGVSRGQKPQHAMRLLINGLRLQMGQLNPAGRRVLQDSMVAWGAQLARDDPKMRKPVGALNSWIISQFQNMGVNVRIVNGQILDGSTAQWNSIYSALTDPMKRAQAVLDGTFGEIEKKAIGELETMGLTARDARTILKNPQSANAWVKWYQTGQSGGSGTAVSRPGAHAAGGRILGDNPRDVYTIGNNTFGGGELVMNRHHELEANARLMRHGEPTVGSIVANRKTPHWAFAAGGRANATQVNAATGAGGTGYIYPFPAGTNIGRTDQGIDATMPPGSPIGPIGDATVIGIQPNWYAGQPYVWWRLNSGPRAGQYAYVSEQITNIAPPGTHLAANQAVARYASSGTAIEYGWATAGGGTLAKATSGYTEGQVTPAGSDMRAFLAGLAHGQIIGGGIGGGPGAAQPIPLPKPLAIPRVKGLGGIPLVLAQKIVGVVAETASNKMAAGVAARGGGMGTTGSSPVGGLSGGVMQQILQAGTQLGFNKLAVAGLIGNAVQESSLNPAALGGGAAGLFQWTPPTALMQYAGAHHAPWQAVGTQMGLVAQTIGGGGISAMNSAGSPSAAALWFMNNFERPGIPAASHRTAAAEQAYRQGYAGGGRVANWAGWHRDGGVFRTNGPTIFGAGEAHVPETVHVQPDSVGSNNTRPIHIEIHKIEVHRPGDVQRIVDEELGKLADSLRNP